MAISFRFMTLENQVENPCVYRPSLAQRISKLLGHATQGGIK